MHDAQRQLDMILAEIGMALLMAIDILFGCILLWAALELMLGLKPLPSRPLKGMPPRYCIVCPAHDESALIGPVAESLLASLCDRGRLLVVADNCTDDTADVARKVGAEVIERADLAKRGKGFALDFARAHLAADPPEIVVVVDADCRFERGNARVIASAAQLSNEPVQATNLVGNEREGNGMVALSNFAFRVKNLVRARGLQRMAGGITVQGTGIAIPWEIFVKLRLASDDPVEDLGYTIQLANCGVTVGMCEHAGVKSNAASTEASITQRTRWEHGFVRTALRQLLPLLREAILTRSRHRIGLAMHLAVPPLALLALMCAGLLAGNVLLYFVMGAIAPLLILSGCLAIFSLALIMAWAVEGRDTVSGIQLLRVPFYIVWKLPIYLSLLAGRKRGWLRTPRE